MKKLLAGLASLVSLVACGEDAPYSSITNFSSRESVYQFFFTATSRGPLLVDVQGSYPGFDSTEITPLIHRAMEKGMGKRPFKATNRIEEADSPAFRVIWLISPPKSYNPNRVCEGRIPASEPQDKPTFGIVFCKEDQVLRDMSGWVNADVSADSRNFEKFVGVVTRELFK